MRNADTILPNITGTARWIARIIGLFLVLFILYIFIEDGRGFAFSGIKRSETFRMVGMLCAILGLVIGWFWEGIGGILTIAGLVTFTIASYYSGEGIAWNTWVLAIPAVLFIFYWWRTN